MARRRTQVKRQVNLETGEVTKELEEDYSIAVDQQLFTMLLLPLDKRLFAVKQAKDFHVLLKLYELADYNTGRVLLTGSQRQDVMTACSISSQHLSSSLKRLADAEVITTRRGEASINPHVAWKGTASHRRNAIKNQATTSPPAK